MLLGGASTMLFTNHPAVVTAAQIVVAMLSVVTGVFLTRVLHDSVPSEVRSGVSSGVGAATWATFMPFALGFGLVSERWGVQVAGWLLVAVALAIACLLVPVTRRTAAHSPITIAMEADVSVENSAVLRGVATATPAVAA